MVFAKVNVLIKCKQKGLPYNLVLARQLLLRAGPREREIFGNVLLGGRTRREQ